MPGDILDLIDNALEDWSESASDDAMRWAPDQGRVICDGGRLWPERWSALRHGSYRYSVSTLPADARIAGFTSVPAWTAISPEEIAGATAEWTCFWSSPDAGQDSDPAYQDTPGSNYLISGPQEWGATFEFRDFCAEQIARAFGFCVVGGELHYHSAHPTFRDLRRCPACNPRTGPRKLPINGHAYARRRAARKKR